MGEMQLPGSPLALLSYLASATGFQSTVMLETAELALRRFGRSRWLILTLLLTLVLFLVCFRYPFGASYFYDIATFGLGAITAMVAYILVRSVVPPMRYIRLGRRTSLESVFAGLVLAMAAISASLILLVLVLALITSGLPTPGGSPRSRRHRLAGELHTGRDADHDPIYTGHHHGDATSVSWCGWSWLSLPTRLAVSFPCSSFPPDC